MWRNWQVCLLLVIFHWLMRRMIRMVLSLSSRIRIIWWVKLSVIFGPIFSLCSIMIRRWSLWPRLSVVKENHLFRRTWLSVFLFWERKWWLSGSIFVSRDWIKYSSSLIKRRVLLNIFPILKRIWWNSFNFLMWIRICLFFRVVLFLLIQQNCWLVTVWIKRLKPWRRTSIMSFLILLLSAW